MKNKYLLFFFLIASFCALSASTVFAQKSTNLGPIIGIGPWQIIPTDAGVALSKIFSTILGFLTALGGLAAFLFLVTGALSWITAAGDKAGLEKARGQITNAVIGLVIIIAAWSIVYLIGGILGLDILNPQNLLPKLSPNYQAPAGQAAPGTLKDKCQKQGGQLVNGKCNIPL